MLEAPDRCGGRAKIVECHAIGVQAGSGIEQVEQGGLRFGHLVGDRVVHGVRLLDDAACHVSS